MVEYRVFDDSTHTCRLFPVDADDSTCTALLARIVATKGGHPFTLYHARIPSEGCLALGSKHHAQLVCDGELTRALYLTPANEVTLSDPLPHLSTEASAAAVHFILANARTETRPVDGN